MRLLLILALLAPAALALSPPPEGFRTLGFDSLWFEVDRVLLARVTALRLPDDALSERDYVVTLKIERTWRGESGQTIDIRMMTAKGDGLGYTFEIGRRYVIFAVDSGSGVSLRYAKPHENHRAPVPALFGGNESTKDILIGGGYLEDSRSLSEFLILKEKTEK